MAASEAKQRIVTEIAARAGGALRLLHQAYAYAAAADCDPWEFAVEIESLCASGLTHNDLRWLVRQGFAEHRIETTGPSARERRFRRSRNLSFTSRSCFVRTELGAQLNPPREGPRWDGALRELWFGDQLVKRFRQPAPSQELVLEAFQEEHWPSSMDDPLPPQAEQDVKARLRVTIQNLNRNQQTRLIRFVSDGRGRGIGWRSIP